MSSTLEYKWWGWGRSDEPHRFPVPASFWKYLSEKLGTLGAAPPIESLDDIQLPPTRLTDSELNVLQNAIGEINLSVDAQDRAVHSLGKSYVDLIRIRRGQIPHPTDVVVYPEEESQIEALLRLARERCWVVIPFGGGTSVVGGASSPPLRPGP